MEKTSYLEQIEKTFERVGFFVRKYSFGLASSIVGFTIVVAVMALSLVPLPFTERLDNFKIQLYIIVGVILVVFGGLFMFLDKVLIVRHQQKYALVLLQMSGKMQDQVKEISGKQLTDLDAAVSRSLDERQNELDRDRQRLRL